MANVVLQEYASIFTTMDYNIFKNFPKLENPTRISYLLVQAKYKNEPLPIIEVRTSKEHKKLEVINDQDSFEVAKILHRPIYFYRSPHPCEPRKRELILGDESVLELCSYMVADILEAEHKKE